MTSCVVYYAHSVVLYSNTHAKCKPYNNQDELVVIAATCLALYGSAYDPALV